MANFDGEFRNWMIAIQTPLLLAVIALMSTASLAAQRGDWQQSDDYDSAGNPRDSGASLTIAASIAPMQYLIDRIGGGHIVSSSIIPPGGDPHTFRVSPSSLSLLNDADALFVIGGLEIERHVAERIAAGQYSLPIFYFDESLAYTEGLGYDDYDDDHDHDDDYEHDYDDDHDHDDDYEHDYDDDHDHDDEHGHDHSASYDPHIWMSPSLTRRVADDMLARIIKLSPDRESLWREGHRELIDDIEKIDNDLRALLRNRSNRRFYVVHPAFGLFAKDYGLIQISLEEDGHDPSSASLARLIAQARADRVAVIIDETQYPSRGATLMADAIGASIESVNPLAYDLFATWKRLGKIISEN